MAEGDVKNLKDLFTEDPSILDQPFLGAEQVSQGRVRDIRSPEYRVETPRQAIIDTIEYLRPFLSATGGTAAAAAGSFSGPGAIAAGAAGTGVTDLAIQDLISRFGGTPRSATGGIFGLESGSPADRFYAAGEEVALNEVLGLAGRGAIRLFRPGLEGLKGAFIKSYVPRSSSKIFNRMPNAPTRYSNIIDSELVGGFEGLMAVKASAKKDNIVKSFIDEKKGNIVAKLLDAPEGEVIDSFDISNLYLGQVKQAYSDLAEASIAAGERIKNIARLPANITFEEVFINKKASVIPVNGPIYLKESVGWAHNFLKSIDDNYTKKLGTQAESQLVNAAKVDQRILVPEALEIIKIGAQVTKKGKILEDGSGNVLLRPISFEAAWKNKSRAGDIGFNSSAPHNVEGRQLQRSYRSISKALDTDIETSIGEGYVNQETGELLRRPWKNSEEALRNYKYSKRLTSTRIAFHEKADLINKIRKQDTIGIEKIRPLLRNEGTVLKALRAGRSRRELQAALFNDTFEKALNAGNRLRYDPDSLRKSWYSPQTQRVAKKLFSKEGELQRMNDFIEYAIRSQTRESKTGKVALGIRLISGMLYLSGAIATGQIFRGGITPGTAGVMTGTGIYVGLNQFTKRILLNDKASRAFSLLIHGPQTTERQRQAMRVVAGALRGIKVLAESNQGGLVEAEIKENGLDIDENSTIQDEFAPLLNP